MNRPRSSAALLDRYAVWIYFGLSLIFAWQLLVPGYSLFRWDILTFCWPFIVDAQNQFAAGHFPFWSSDICCGTPALENIAIGLLYPLQIPCWILPLPTGYHIFLFLHSWLTFLGMHLLLRKGLGLGWWESLAGALVYGASGYARVTWDIQFFTSLPWIPLCLAAMLVARHKGRALLAILLTGLSCAMMFYAGDIQTALLWMPVAGLLALIHPQRKRLIPVLIGGVLLGLLLAAPQWLTTALYLPETWRGSALGEGETLERSFNPVRLLELFMPYAFGNRDTWFGRSLPGMHATKVLPWTPSFHIGVLGTLCALLAVRKRSRPVCRWAALVLIVSLLLSFGRFTPVFVLWQKLPVIGGFRFPEKYLTWSLLALAVLAGYGFSTLKAVFARTQLHRLRMRLVWVWGAVLAVAFLTTLGVGTSLNPNNSAYVSWAIRRMTNITVLWLVLLAWAAAADRKFPGRIAISVLLVADLLTHWYVEQPLTRRFSPLDAPAVAQVISNSGDAKGRFIRDLTLEQVPLPSYYHSLRHSEKQAVGQRARLLFNSPVIWGMRTPLGYSSLASAELRKFQLQLLDEAGSIRTNASATATFCLDANVKWLLTAHSRVTEMAAAGLEFDIFAQWPSPDPVTLLHLTNTHFADVRSATVDVVGELPIIKQIEHVHPGRMEIRLASGSTCSLHLKETYNRGWRATDQDQENLLVHSDPPPFLAVDIPEGTTSMSLRYLPIGWYPALACFAIGLLVTAALVFMSRRGRAKRGDQ